MKIGIYSNTDQLCGNAEYARDLQYELSQQYAEPIMVAPDVERHGDKDSLWKCDVILISWSPSRVPTTPELIRNFQAEGKKVIVIWQESYQTIVDPGSWGVEGVLRAADAVVAHEPVQCFREIDYIPHGITMIGHRPPEDGIEEGFSVGVAGFPFAWKNFDFVASLAKYFHLRLRMIAPYHDMLQNNAGTDLVRIKHELGEMAEIHHGWLPVHEVVQKLARCTFNVFWFNSGSIVDELGQSGSVRMGIAAGRPMIISRHRKMKTLMDYADEFYIADTADEVQVAVKSILGDSNPRRPDRILKDQGWPTVAQKYKDLIERVAA